ncbi:hypothetical protein PMAYCL1PPCAC_29196 [Pristionchus mayeri]|uniref:Uncharacterized protein n=1 Tax=Pristionchus mayeri TaxID=1317129 RepID=A0AAN5D8Z7_9BILA|nr:hypothetical protein PMAYCL1PPCAC_29196 [Pristionchus mayeri]
MSINKVAPYPPQSIGDDHGLVQPSTQRCVDSSERVPPPSLQHNTSEDIINVTLDQPIPSEVPVSHPPPRQAWAPKPGLLRREPLLSSI